MSEITASLVWADHVAGLQRQLADLQSDFDSLVVHHKATEAELAATKAALIRILEVVLSTSWPGINDRPDLQRTRLDDAEIDRLNTIVLSRLSRKEEYQLFFSNIRQAWRVIGRPILEWIKCLSTGYRVDKENAKRKAAWRRDCERAQTLGIDPPPPPNELISKGIG